MQLAIGVYHFAFKDEYASTNGVYKVAEVMDLMSVRDHHEAALINFLKTDPAADASAMLASYENTRTTFFRLVDPQDPEIEIVIPDNLFVAFPEESPTAYSKLKVVVDAGVTDSKEKLTFVITKIKELLHAEAGIDPADTLLVEYDEVWLTQRQYDKIVAQREATKQSGSKSYYAMVQQLNQDNTRLQERVKYLEQALVDAANGGNNGA